MFLIFCSNLHSKFVMTVQEKTKKRKILVVDDDERFIYIIRKRLTDFGYTVSFLTRPDYVIKRLTEEAFDLVLLDINLPGTDGISLFRQFKYDKNLESIPVIFITSHRDETIFSKCFELGAADFIEKPISPIVLNARVKSVIDSKLYREELKRNIKLQVQMIDDLKYTASELEKANRQIEQQNRDLEYRVKERTRQLEESKNRSDIVGQYNRSLINNSPDGICLLDMEGKIIDCNQAFTNIFKADVKDITGRNIKSFYVPDELEKWDSWWEPTRDGNVIRYESINLRWDGSRFPVSVSAVVVEGARDKEPGIIYTLRDETRFKKTEAALERQLEEAARLNKELEQTNKGIIALWREIEDKNEALEDQNRQLRRQEKLLQGLIEAKNFLLTERDLTTAISYVLKSVGKNAGIDRIDIIEVNNTEISKAGAFKLNLRWDSDDHSRHKPDNSASDLGEILELEKWYPSLLNGDTYFGKAVDFGASGRQYLDLHSFNSIMCVPISMWKNPWIIACYTKISDYQWSTAEESMIISVAESISRAFEKKRAEEEYKKYQEELIRNQALLQDIDLARKLRDIVTGNPPMIDNTFTFFKKFRSVGEGGGDSSSFKNYQVGDKKYIVCSLNDQVGHGVEGVLKSILFEYLLHQPNTYLGDDGSLKLPSEQLQIMNQSVLDLSDVPGSSACTAQLLVIDYESLTLLYASAGHHPAILIRADGKVIELDRKGMYIGYFPSVEYYHGEIQLYPGDKILQFTDGLFEIFRNQEEWFGYARLLNTIKKHSHLSIDRIYESIMQDLSAFTDLDMLRYMEGAENHIGQGRQLDDILFVGIEVDPIHYYKAVMSSPINLAEIDALKNDLVALAKQHDFPNQVIRNIEFSVHEAIVNASEHGNKDNPEKRIFIRYAIEECETNRLVIEITDEGVGFQPNQILSKSDQNRLSVRGRGIHWITSLADKAEYNQTGNSVTLYFN